MADLADQAESEIELQERLAWAARAALVADDTGDGTCRDCGEPIQPERLRISPTALRCIDCQIDHERREAHEARLYSE